jgi:hypothetical protein
MFGTRFSKAKSTFLDEKIIDRFANASRRVLNRFGAFVRQRAKSSIRARRKASPPGQPPSKHTGVLKDLIVFNVDRSPSNVVIGPLLANQLSFKREGKNLRPVKGTVPEVLEDGGSLLVIEEFRHGRWRRVDLRRRGAQQKFLAAQSGSRRGQIRTRRVHVKPRPFMQPAFDQVIERELDKLWDDSLK